MKPGDIVTTEGEVIGKHEGHQNFTIGQRRGLGVATGMPLYVINRDPVSNQVMVGNRENLDSNGLLADQANWFITPPEDWIPCRAQIRYNASPVPARVKTTGADQFIVEFASAQMAVAPGQAVVCYHEDVVIGGGWIQKPLMDVDENKS